MKEPCKKFARLLFLLKNTAKEPPFGDPFVVVGTV